MPDNARAALAAMVSATGDTPAGQALCARLLDGAVETLRTAPAAALADLGLGATILDRLEAMSSLAEVCANCRLCARGRSIEYMATVSG